MEEFNKKTSKLINDMFGRFRMLRLTHMVIKEYFRISVKFHTFSYELRHARATSWRTLVKTMTAKEKSHSGAAQKRTGRRRDHQALMLESFGEFWHDDPSIVSPNPRKPFVNEFICTVSKNFNLHEPFNSITPAQRVLISERRQRIADKFSGAVSINFDFNLMCNLSAPLPPFNNGDALWQMGGLKQVEFVVDNFALAEILAGRALYTPHLSCTDSLIEESCRELDVLLGSGWTPRCQMLDVVRWGRRAWNTLADLAGRFAVQRSEGFIFIHPQFKSMLSDFSCFQFHSDGGKSKEGSSAAFSLTVWDTRSQPPTRTLIAICAEFVQMDLSPFHLEVQSLLLAFKFFRSNFLD